MSGGAPGDPAGLRACADRRIGRPAVRELQPA